MLVTTNNRLRNMIAENVTRVSLTTLTPPNPMTYPTTVWGTNARHMYWFGVVLLAMWLVFNIYLTKEYWLSIWNPAIMQRMVVKQHIVSMARIRLQPEHRHGSHEFANV
jgi:hypothetical protein